jgi:citrate lyase beta subunit
MHTTLDGSLVAGMAARLSEVDGERARRYPGDHGGRQPVHTCYVPADRIVDDLPAQWGAAAMAAMDDHAPDAAAIAGIIGVPAALAPTVFERVRAKLETEPVEDLRIDFEDGYGTRDDPAEDADALRAAGLIRTCGLAGVGIRMKSFDTNVLLHRAVSTLDLVLTELAVPPPGFVITFPKVTGPQQVSTLVELLEVIEERLALPSGSLRFEIQIETTQAVIDHSGRFAIPGLIEAGQGRVSGLHFGTYDYTAACGLSAADQHLAHAACDFARNVMQVSAAGTGVRLSDGSSNVLPVGDAVREGWRTHYALVRRSLSHGFFQGWDLHPAQLVSRYCAVFAHHLETADADGQRLAAYVARTAGTVLDEPATAAALAMSLRRAVDCGALTADEVTKSCGLSADDLTALIERRPR